MRRVLLVVTAALAGMVLLSAAAGTAAAASGKEFGDTCTGTQSAPFASIFEISHRGSPLRAAAPTYGVLTGWKLRLPAESPFAGSRQSIRVVRIAGPDSVEAVARSAAETIHGGINEFETRLPIEIGDLLALGSSAGGTIACSTLAPGEIGAVGGGLVRPLPQPGATAAFAPSGYTVPVAGVIERDKDEDGFGDATQDGCPESDEFQGPCPTVRFAPGFEVGAHAIRVRVRSSQRALVVVEGLRPELGASMGTRKTIPARKPTTFRLELTPVTEKLLRRLPSSKTLRFKFTARVAGIPGNVSADQTYLKIPGRG